MLHACETVCYIVESTVAPGCVYEYHDHKQRHKTGEDKRCRGGCTDGCCARIMALLQPRQMALLHHDDGSASPRQTYPAAHSSTHTPGKPAMHGLLNALKHCVSNTQQKKTTPAWLMKGLDLLHHACATGHGKQAHTTPGERRKRTLKTARSLRVHLAWNSKQSGLNRKEAACS